MEQSNILGSFTRRGLNPKLIGAVLTGAVLALGSNVALAQPPAGAAVGQTPVPGSAKAGRWDDKNNDGIIQKDEVTPGSQLEKRFATRDKNGDGQLSPDEYYVPK